MNKFVLLVIVVGCIIWILQFDKAAKECYAQNGTMVKVAGFGENLTGYACMRNR